MDIGGGENFHVPHVTMRLCDAVVAYTAVVEAFCETWSQQCSFDAAGRINEILLGGDVIFAVTWWTRRVWLARYISAWVGRGRSLWTNCKAL